MPYLVTGATGNVGARVVSALVARGERPRVLVREQERARARFDDRVVYAVGDLSDPRALRAACDGIDVLFLLTAGARIAELDTMAAQAAKDAGVRRIVKLSAQGARASGQATAVAQWHARGEEAIRASGLPFTFLRCVGFMTNALAWASSIRASGVVRASTGGGRIAMVHPDDIAAVASEALVNDQLVGQAFPVTGPEPLSYAEMTEQIALAIGKPLRFEPLSDAEARASLLEHGLEPDLADALSELWRELREGKVELVTDDVERVLGRKPITFARFAAEHAQVFSAH